MNRSVRLLTIAFAASVVSATIACSSEKHQSAVTPETVRDVSVLNVAHTTVPDYVDAIGTVRASQSAQVASQLMGNIVRLYAQEGDHVRRGQVLAALEETQPRAGMERAQAGVSASEQDVVAAEADYVFAESTLKRYQSLFDKKSVSPQEFDEVKMRFAAAKAHRDATHAGQSQTQAALVQARSGYEYTKIRAPFDGVVTAKLADAGTLATPGTPVFVIENPAKFRLEANVDERAMGAVRLGGEVPVVIDSLGTEPIRGKVVQIVPAADPASRSFLVKVELPANPKLRSGLFGRARFEQGQRESLMIPQTALIHRGQLDGLYIVGKDQIANLRYVTLGRADGKSVEVLSGLDNGERVVAQPGDLELSGKKIEVR